MRPNSTIITLPEDSKIIEKLPSKFECDMLIFKYSAEAKFGEANQVASILGKVKRFILKNLFQALGLT